MRLRLGILCVCEGVSSLKCWCNILSASARGAPDGFSFLLDFLSLRGKDHCCCWVGVLGKVDISILPKKGI